jgi:hypothetical protein
MAKDENDFATGVVNTGGKLSLTLVANLPHLDLRRKFVKKFEMTLILFSEAWGKMIHGKKT